VNGGQAPHAARHEGLRGMFTAYNEFLVEHRTLMALKIERWFEAP
jgi:hypothetical protein